MLLRTTRRLSSQFSRTAALEGKLARREASAAIQGKEDAPKLSRADAIEGRLARREAAALLQGAAEASSLTRAEMIEGRLARREAAALVQSLEASPRPNLSRKHLHADARQHDVPREELAEASCDHHLLGLGPADEAGDSHRYSKGVEVRLGPHETDVQGRRAPVGDRRRLDDRGGRLRGDRRGLQRLQAGA